MDCKGSIVSLAHTPGSNELGPAFCNDHRVVRMNWRLVFLYMAAHCGVSRMESWRPAFCADLVLVGPKQMLSGVFSSCLCTRALALLRILAAI